MERPVGGLHDCEVAVVERGDRDDGEPLRSGNDGCVGGPEWEIPVADDELGDAEPIAGGDMLGDQVACREVAEEADLSLGAESRRDEVGDLRDDEHRHDQRAGVDLEQLAARVVMPVVAVNVRIQRAGVDDQRDAPTSSASSSSIRSEMS